MAEDLLGLSLLPKYDRVMAHHTLQAIVRKESQRPEVSNITHCYLPSLVCSYPLNELEMCLLYAI